MVTGASSGIGRATAVLLAARGYHIAAIARRAERLEALGADLGPAMVTPMQADLIEPDQVEATIRQVRETFEHVEVLVHSAGYGRFRPFLEENEAELRRFMEVHYHAAAALVRAVLPGMLQRRRGWVIGVSSISTKASPWGHGGYTAAKNALNAMLHTLHAEHPGAGVHFTVVYPGVIDTEFFADASYQSMSPAVRRHAIPAERVARRIVGLLDRPRLEVYEPRLYRVLDWLNVLVPWLLHGRIARHAMPMQQPAQAPAAKADRDAPRRAIADRSAASDAAS